MSLDILSCCGVFEMHIGNADEVSNPIKELRRQFYGDLWMCSDDFSKLSESGMCDPEGEFDRTPPFIVMTDRTRNDVVGLNKIVKVIKKLRLGSVIQTAARVNDNTGEYIKLWVWSPNWGRVKTFMTKKQTLGLKKGKKIPKASVAPRKPVGNVINKIGARVARAS